MFSSKQRKTQCFVISAACALLSTSQFSIVRLPLVGVAVPASLSPPQVVSRNATNSGFSNDEYLPKSPLNSSRTWATSLAPDNRPRRPLAFLHIPKTGGSSIVLAGAAHGRNWGGCLFPSPWRKSVCGASAGPIQDDETTTWPKHPHDSVWWHTPIQYLPHNVSDPYSGMDIFCVVRNPYERAVSEYYYACKFNMRACFGPNRSNDTPDRMNAHIQRMLKHVFLSEKNGADYFAGWGHWIPQYDYVYDSGGTRRVHHTIHNEFLKTEFDSLMQAYNLSVKLLVTREKSRSELGPACSVSDLSVGTMKLIEVVFANDFREFGYAMLSHRRPELR